MSRNVALLTALFASPILALAGQARPVVAPGDRVRVRTEDRELVGALVAQEDDSLRLQVIGEATPVSFARTALKSLEISRGSHSNARAGALIGLGAGALVGGALGAAANSWAYADCSGCGDAAIAVVAGGLLGGGVGAGVGAAIGSLSHSERWDSVPLH